MCRSYHEVCFALLSAKKVVLQGANTDQLLELHALALSLELPTYLVQDAGRTQVNQLFWGEKK